MTSFDLRIYQEEIEPPFRVRQLQRLLSSVPELNSHRGERV